MILRSRPSHWGRIVKTLSDLCQRDHERAASHRGMSSEAVFHGRARILDSGTRLSYYYANPERRTLLTAAVPKAVDKARDNMLRP